MASDAEELEALDMDKLPGEIKKDAKLAKIAFAIKQKKYAGAIEKANALLKEDNDWLEAWQLKGVAYFALDRYNEAIEAFDNALDISPGDYFSRAQRAQCLIHSGRVEEAVAELLAAEKLEGRARKEERVNLLITAAAGYLILGKGEEAGKAIARAFEINDELAVRDVQALFEKILLPLPDDVLSKESKLGIQTLINVLVSEIKEEHEKSQK